MTGWGEVVGKSVAAATAAAACLFNKLSCTSCNEVGEWWLKSDVDKDLFFGGTLSAAVCNSSWAASLLFELLPSAARESLDPREGPLEPLDSDGC